jgi:hypothetical protein
MRLADAQTYLGGKDPDGWRCAPADLIGALMLAGGRAVVFPLMERAGYQAANDAVLAAASASQGRLIPFCRVNPHATPVRELERCLSAGARGVKLHPRAERFNLRHPGVTVCLSRSLNCWTRHQRYARTTRLDGRRAAGFHLVLAAAALAATPDVP